MTNRLLEEHKKRVRFVKLCICIILAGVILVAGLSYYKHITIETLQEDARNQLNQTQVVNWLNSFLAHEFEKCDTLSYDRIEEPNWVEFMDSYDEIFKVMDGLVDCIESAKIKNADLGVYTVEVICTPYKLVNDVQVDKAHISEIGNSYANNDIYSTQLQEELDRIYEEGFKDTVFSKDLGAKKVTIELTLSEKQTNGTVLVYGTKDFINKLLTDTNILSNLKVYQDNMKDTVEKYLVEENRM